MLGGHWAWGNSKVTSEAHTAHPSLAGGQGFSLVCGSAGLGAADWSPEALPPGTTPLAGPLPGISKTVLPSGGALHCQRVPLAPAHRKLPTSSQVRGRPTGSPIPCWAHLAILTTKVALSLCPWPSTCHIQPYLQQHSRRRNVGWEEVRLPAWTHGGLVCS